MEFLVRHLIIVVAFSCVILNAVQAEPQTMKDTANESASEIKKSPIVIWYHTIGKDPNILRKVLSRDVVTHVMLSGMHKEDVPDYFSRRDFMETYRMCQKAGVALIFERWLWPGYNCERFKLNDVFSPSYYRACIRAIKKEADQIKAKSAFDLEPYGRSVVRKLRQRDLTEDEYARISQAVAEAVETEGPVDYVLPAAFPYPAHTRFTRGFYRPFSRSPVNLARFSIAEHTYYNLDRRLFCEDNVYDVFGVYPKRFPPALPPDKAPFFTGTEIYSRRDLWAHKKGLWIYPGEGKEVMDLATEFSQLGNPR
ncbi:MAG: hypothetical protein JXL84_17560 [Deltaproteobacteria bacterium]|nr:hypothetical protein [Deltaproteobacteria bacterium]